MFKIILLSLFTMCASLSAATQAVVFDFGGVLNSSNTEVLSQFLCKSFHLTPEKYDRLKNEWREASKAGKKDEEFWMQYAKDHHISLSENWLKEFKAAIRESIGINTNMYALVDKLKAQHIRVGLLSNIQERKGRMIRENGFYAPFSPCLLSFELGVEKPDPVIFQALLKAMPFHPADIMFIDDKQENVDAAKKLGLDAVLFTSQEQLEKDLLDRGVKL